MVKNSKKSSEFYVGQPVLAQILKYLDNEALDEIAKRYDSDYYTKKLSTRNHLVSLLFGIISACDSLREIVLLLAAEQMKLGHLSIRHKVCRSTLARANGKRTPKVFEAVFRSVFLRNRKFLLDSNSFEPAVENLYAIDSTTITLYTDILGGTGKPSYKDGRQKGGAKVHVVSNVKEGVPGLAKITKAAISDVKQMGMLLGLPKGSYMAMDKAYSDHEMLERFSRAGLYYVTRLKDNVNYRVTHVFSSCGGRMGPERIVRDECIAIRLPEKKEHVCRRVEYIGLVKDRNGVEHEKLFVFLTNNLRLHPLKIAQIYRNRWQIELLFKSMKQNFQLKYFYGDSVNAIKNQIWATLLAHLLLTIVHRRAARKRKWAFSNVVSIVRALIMSYISIELMLGDPEMFPRIMFSRPPPEPDLFSMAGIEQ